MNAVHEETTYRCINPACTRAMPRAVAFCPYCGTDQAAPHAPPPPAPAAGEAARTAAATAGASAVAALMGWSDAPQGEAAPAPADARPAPPPVPPAPPARPTPAPAPAPDTAFGRTGGAPPTPPNGPKPYHIWGRGAAAPAPAASRGPGGREPIQLRWWLAILVVLAGVWLWAKPSAHKVERRIQHAVALAHECKAREAQDELIALRADRATAEQLERLQQSLNDEAAACTRRRLRDRAWRDTSDNVEAALDAPTPATLDRARSRVQAFTRKYGEDANTRALLGRIDDARHPLADPAAR